MRHIKLVSIVLFALFFVVIKPHIITLDNPLMFFVVKHNNYKMISRNENETHKQHKTIEVIATAYTQSKEEGTINGITFTGHKVRHGVVAVDPKVIPLGSKLYIEGYGYAEALDTGGAIKGYRIDLFMESKKEALQWGRKKVKVTILETGGMSDGTF
jgi:3D (Asp-Asp-Asp) domain-containing protein